ncbi:MAG: excinuclease ABC subunit UvrA [Candidatus Paceibacterota bacterium]|nr:MAG: excinuclease ABC subunit UvrA [Candidatus Paceibacterota bacterium]
MQKNSGDKIIVRGARTHNLKNITVEMPRNKITVITGLSGSGKSSLAFDTIFAEGQRRYIESLSPYARQFLRIMPKPDVDEISGLSPAISIDQKFRSGNPRSTVATMTEIYDYLRILFARIGRPHCLICGKEIEKMSREEIKNLIVKKIREKITKSGKESTLEIYSPVVRGRKGEYYQLLYDLLGRGYSKVSIDGQLKSLRQQIILSKNKKHNIDILVDEIKFSDLSLSVPTNKDWQERLGEDLEKALEESEGLVKIIFNFGKTEKEEFVWSTKFSCPSDGYSYPEIEPRMFSFNSPYGACQDCNGLGTKHYWGSEPCPNCNGSRLRKEALKVLISGKNIVEIGSLSISEADEFFGNIKLNKKEKEISEVAIREIVSRLKFMINVGIEYLTLDRRAGTLSGGEAQRIRLASQLGSGLVGALYVLDEPTIGLHAHDNNRLVKTLAELRDLGNTIIIVEHDEDTIYSSDYIVDIGPGAGIHGGEVVVSGFLEKLLTEANSSASRKNNSLTLDYLRGDNKIPVPEKRRDTEKGKIIIKGGKVFNIKNLNAEIPLGKFVVITGLSGSGKSSLLYEILHKNLQARFDRRYRSAEIFNCQSFTGTEYLNRAILIDQSPIGRTPRSNPATYTGAWTFIRELFAETSEAKVRGWKPSRFSFNVKGGRCEACQGNGTIEVEMQFLPTVYVTCDVCNGRRFMKETLEVKYKKKNIYDVLKMTIEEALDFFKDIPGVYDRLKTMDEVGLSYLELGQSATTLSGGEAQRVKISSELFRPDLYKTIYLLDEPTVGLHYEDVKKLVEILQKLVDKGNTVVTIEHNMDFIKNSDYIIDMGPEGGDRGGEIVAKGTPEQIAQSKDSYTGEYLRKTLKKE